MKNKLIVALDVPEINKAKELINILGETVVFYKVGLELFLNSRGEILDYLQAKEKKIFLDLKFHDIPNTVAQAVRWAAGLGVDMLDVHASGGREMMQAAVEIAKNVSLQKGFAPPLIVGVTVLTSFTEESFSELGFKNSLKQSASLWAKISEEAGLDGVVCSPQEAAEIKKLCGSDFLTVCPGVRPLGSETQDQKRVTTPAQALKMGADYLVVGRPITKSIDPIRAAVNIIEEMRGGSKNGFPRSH